MRSLSNLLLVALLGTLPAHAQTTANGSIRGVVKDDHGAVIPQVAVSATSPTVPGVHVVTTDPAGRYRLGDLPPGDYTIVAEMAGFARFLQAPVVVRAGLNIDLDIVMRVGAIDETVEVRREAPLIETQDAGQSVNVSGDLLRNIPLLERHEWFGALTITPGVTSAEFVNNERLFSVHGADSNANVVQANKRRIGIFVGYGWI
jgi:carboxypeptidase family protein